MLRTWLILLGMSASALVAASCAETGAALESAAIAQEAKTAATQVVAAATQIASATTRELQAMAQQPMNLSLPQFNNKFGKQPIIVDLPDYTVVFIQNQEVVIKKPAPMYTIMPRNP